MILTLLVILFITILIYFGIKPLYFWKEYDVPQENIWNCFLWSYFGFFSRRQLTDFVIDLYQKFPGHRYYGFYQLNKPILILKDAELLKQMMIKDFEHFNEHPDFISKEVDPVFGKNLFSLKGNEWKHMRSTLSPSFTSSKMKGMFIFMKENSEKLLDYFLNKNENLIDIEMKDITGRFCNDVIASTAFGTEVDSFRNPDNDFLKYGTKLTDLRQLSTMIRLLISMRFKSVAKAFKIKFMSDDVGEFFTEVIEETIRVRQEKGIVRPDMIHLLMEAQKGNQKIEDTSADNIADTGFATVEEHFKGSVNQNITNEEIIAQALIFFFGGFDSVSTFMCFLAYELCANQDIQNRLREEIEETSENCNGKLTYEALVKMKYMDLVITECLRKWPIQVAVGRICTKPYVIQPTLPHEKPLHVTIGQELTIPIYGIHHDPENFPNPETFDPERFNEQNKDDIKSNSFMPFGLGPRNCIGSRFALLETKIMFFYLLKYFKIVPTEKTVIPIKMVKNFFSILPPNGFWMGLQRIQK